MFQYQTVNYIFKNLEKGGVWYFWITADLGDVAPHSSFVKIRVGHPTMAKVGVTFEGLLEHFHTDSESVTGQLNCLVLSPGMIEKFRDVVTNKISVTYTVCV